MCKCIDNGIQQLTIVNNYFTTLLQSKLFLILQFVMEGNNPKDDAVEIQPPQATEPMQELEEQFQ